MVPNEVHIAYVNKSHVPPKVAQCTNLYKSMHCVELWSISTGEYTNMFLLGWTICKLDL